MVVDTARYLGSVKASAASATQNEATLEGAVSGAKISTANLKRYVDTARSGRSKINAIEAEIKAKASSIDRVTTQVFELEAKLPKAVAEVQQQVDQVKASSKSYNTTVSTLLDSAHEARERAKHSALAVDKIRADYSEASAKLEASTELYDQATSRSADSTSSYNMAIKAQNSSSPAPDSRWQTATSSVYSRPSSS